MTEELPVTAERPVHPSAEEVAEDGVEVVRDTGTDVRRTLKPRVSSKRVKTEEKAAKGEKENKAP